MPKAISNTSPLLYLYRIGAINWLPKLFDEIWTPEAVQNELLAGRSKGYNVPNPADYPWLNIVNPKSMPSEWLALDLGAGEIAAMALALENPTRVILLDDMLARRTSQAAGLQVWGTLKVLLEAKSQGLVDKIEPYVTNLSEAGMWVSPEVKHRILILAGEILKSRACQQSLQRTVCHAPFKGFYSLENVVPFRRLFLVATRPVTQTVETVEKVPFQNLFLKSGAETLKRTLFFVLTTTLWRFSSLLWEIFATNFQSEGFSTVSLGAYRSKKIQWKTLIILS